MTPNRRAAAVNGDRNPNPKSQDPGLRVRLKARPDAVGTIVGVAPAKPHHRALTGQAMSFRVEWDESSIRGLTYGEDVLEFLPDPQSQDSRTGGDRG